MLSRVRKFHLKHRMFPSHLFLTILIRRALFWISNSNFRVKETKTFLTLLYIHTFYFYLGRDTRSVSVNAAFVFTKYIILPAKCIWCESGLLCNYGAFHIVFVVRSERHEARLASQRKLIRLTHLPDALGPPCTARRSGSPCVCMCTSVVKYRH